MAENPTPLSSPGDAFPATKTAKILYFNGFFLGMSNADILLRLNLDQTELLDLRMSFTVAKTLSIKLAETVARFEKITDHKVMTTEDVFKALQTVKPNEPK